MKKRLLLSLFTLVSIFSKAQQEEESKFKIEKGSWNYEAQTSLNLYEAMPKGIQVGYTIKDNWVIGLGLENVSTSISPFPAILSEEGYGTFAFVKKYFPISKKLAFSIQGDIKYSNIRSGVLLGNNFTENRRFHRYNLSFKPELTYFLSKNVATKFGFGSIGYGIEKDRANNINNNLFDANILQPSHFSFGIILNF